MTTPNWQHHSRKQPKYKSKPRMVQAAGKRTKMLIQTVHLRWRLVVFLTWRNVHYLMMPH